MRPRLEDIAAYFVCPDDGAKLAKFSEGLRCAVCTRTFPIWADNILELLPSRAFSMPKELESTVYAQGYHREFSRTLAMGQEAKAWGAPEGLPAAWLQSRNRQVIEALHFLRADSQRPGPAFCDLSAGSGNCTFEAAKQYRLVFHCELSVDSLLYASEKAKRNGIKNIVFVRADYFQPAFQNSIDHLVCLDTLIRGPWHELAILDSIRRVLSNHGAAVVDFHNWWHNPLRRMGLLPENFSGNKSYSRGEVKKLLANAGIDEFQTQRFVQEVSPADGGRGILGRLIPPTRWMVRMTGGSGIQTRPASARTQECRV